MNKLTQRYFAEQDNRPPPGVNPMVVRRTARRRFGPYEIVLETSCGTTRPKRPHGSTKPLGDWGRIAGSVRITLYDARSDEPDFPVAVKRLQVDNWREAQDEVRRLEHALKGS